MIISWKRKDESLKINKYKVDIISNNDKKTEFLFIEDNFSIESFIRELKFENIENFEISNFSLEEVYVNIMEGKNE